MSADENKPKAKCPFNFIKVVALLERVRVLVKHSYM